ncbi:MAG TPA: cation:proton antiporter [Bryobacteraceae bacterium]|nr:cation:proton antiporter [Bryobacteraceae bacterium]
MRLLLLLILGGLMHAAGTFAPQPGVGSGAAGTALACGYLLLSGFFLGSLFRQVGLPKLTGYIVLGIVAGPQVLGLLSPPMVANLQIFNGAATALIALTAGVELDLRSIRPLMRSILALIGGAMLGTAGLLTAAVYFWRDLLPFLHELTPEQALAMALVLGVTMSAGSPAVVVALRSEMEADGPLTRTVLGVVVMADLVVILLFAVVSSAAKATLGGNADALGTAATLAWELLGSIGSGLLVGGVLAIFLRFVRQGTGLFVVTVAFVVAEVGMRIDFDPLIVALAAGMLVRNTTALGDRLQEAIEGASLPVYVAFFAVTGANIHLRELLIIGIPAALFVTVRAGGFLGLGWLAARVAGAPEVVRRYAGFGLLPQAGLALALALLFVRTFPHFGGEASALVLGAVAINEMLAPVLYRFALVRSGEAGRGQGAAARIPVGANAPAAVPENLVSS